MIGGRHDVQIEVGERIGSDRVVSPRRYGDRFPLFAVPGFLLVVFIAIPLIALVERAVGSPDFWPSLTKPIVRDALRLSAVTTGATLAVALVTGTPLAFLLARRQFRGKRLVETLVDLPLVLPPVVAGIALLVAFGRRGLLGDELRLIGVSLPFSTAAVIVAQVFVAVPFYVRGAKVGFAGVPADVEEAAAIDGATPWQIFRLITVPLALPTLSSGLVLCWARALGEFGATLMLAGNIPGRTQTMPLAIYEAVVAGEDERAFALALILTLISVAAVYLTNLLSRRAPAARFCTNAPRRDQEAPRHGRARHVHARSQL